MADRRRIEVGDSIAIAKPVLQEVLDALMTAGYRPVGPRTHDGAILYDRLETIGQLPLGHVTEQSPGHFRLLPAQDAGYFDFIPGAASWKQFLFPPRLDLLTLRKDDNSWHTSNTSPQPETYAFVGVRPCELAAIQMQDAIFLREDFADAAYRARRSKVFILAVNCLHPAGTCFCATMGTGPGIEAGFDLCLTELDEQFLVKVGSVLGRDIVTDLPSEAANAFLLGKAERALHAAARAATCDLDPATCAQDLMANLEHAHWGDVAKRCLGCGNCTLACPTCFCWDVEDHTNLTRTETRRERVWDSCFNPSYSYQAGGNTRPSIRSRYRQWLTHKFGSWKEQYGTLGCVGCGRCITWCPAGIDTRLEVAAFQKEARR